MVGGAATASGTGQLAAAAATLAAAAALDLVGDA